MLKARFDRNLPDMSKKQTVNEQAKLGLVPSGLRPCFQGPIRSKALNLEANQIKGLEYTTRPLHDLSKFSVEFLRDWIIMIKFSLAAKLQKAPRNDKLVISALKFCNSK